MPLLKLSNRDKQNPHGKFVVEMVSQNDPQEGLANFIKLWRLNFLESMKPQNLPYGWRVEHTIGRTFGAHSKFNKDQSNNGDEDDEEESKSDN